HASIRTSRFLIYFPILPPISSFRVHCDTVLVLYSKVLYIAYIFPQVTVVGRHVSPCCPDNHRFNLQGTRGN
ncbi:hypothetical protein BGY98DRAFT_958759, partial [Russula aff. rugulosa BPL654]